MPIKDLEKRKEYQRELMRKRRSKGLTENVSPNNSVRPDLVSPEKVVSPVSPMLDPNSNVSPTLLDQGLTVRPKERVLDPVRPCSRCPEIENSISEFANLYRQEQEKAKEQKRVNQQLEKQIKELEKPINPTIELWKTRYFDLEKATNQQLSQQQETINRLKEKLREKDQQKQDWEQKYSNLENQTKNTNNYLSMPNLYALISKHKHYQSIQHKYSERDIKERQFLKSLGDKLWVFD